MEEQLIKKNCTTGEYNNIYPITSTSAVKDSTGRTLDDIIENINHVYLPFKDNSRATTRNQVLRSNRKRGLWITYVSCKGNIITEYYLSDDFSDEAWGNNDNWLPYINQDLISDLVNEKLSWYKYQDPK